MDKQVFDFDKIPDMESFYAAAQKQLSLPGYFGKNLDALWDCLTGYIALPVAVSFVNLTFSRLKRFDALIHLFEAAARELSGRLVFDYNVRPGS